jgi:hypothetical protein
MGLIIGLVFMGVFAVIALPGLRLVVGPSSEGQAGSGHARLRPGYRKPKSASSDREPAQGRATQQHSLAEQEAAEIRLTPYLRKTAGSGQPEMERRQAADDERWRSLRFPGYLVYLRNSAVLPALESGW